MKKIIFIFAAVLTVFVACKKDFPTSQTVEETPVTPRSADCMQSYEPFYILLNGDYLNLSRFGQIHNDVLTYAKNNLGTPPQGVPATAVYVNNLANNGLLALANQDPTVLDYIPTHTPMDNEEQAFMAQILAATSVDAANQMWLNRFVQNTNQLVQLGAIGAPERGILINYVTQLVNGVTIDYNALKSSLDAVPNKPYNGVYSYFILTIGSHSSCWWNNELGYSSGTGTPQNVIADFIFHDLISGTVGYTKYMYNNWSHHYEPDFGMNALKAGAAKAVDHSTFGIVEL